MKEFFRCYTADYQAIIDAYRAQDKQREAGMISGGEMKARYRRLGVIVETTNAFYEKELDKPAPEEVKLDSIHAIIAMIDLLKQDLGAAIEDVQQNQAGNNAIEDVGNNAQHSHGNQPSGIGDVHRPTQLVGQKVGAS